MTTTQPALGSFKSQSGFSLIELAIAIIIISLLTIPLLDRFKIYNEQEHIDNTTIALNSINSALGAFYIQNGYYPCPADRSIALGQPEAGVEQCHYANPTTTPPTAAGVNRFTSVGINTCASGGGICKTQGNPGAVYTGGIPYKTLDIPYSDMIDGYRNPISYSVSMEYALNTRANDTSRVGAVSLNKDTVAGGTSTTTVQNNIFYILVSYGEDGKGSYSVQGVPTPCDTSQKDGENCDIDALFLDRGTLRSYIQNANYYDDRVSPTAYAPTSIWAYSSASPGAIYNTNSGPIGIGTTTPDTSVPQMKLDVAGDVKAVQFRSIEYCDLVGSNCFKTKTIAGDTSSGGGMTCPSGQYLIGVANNLPICQQMAVNVTPKTCSSNQYISAITSGGTVVCTNLP